MKLTKNTEVFTNCPNVCLDVKEVLTWHVDTSSSFSYLSSRRKFSMMTMDDTWLEIDAEVVMKMETLK